MTDRTPTTEAGQDVLLILENGLGLHDPVKHILAIEDEAAIAAVTHCAELEHAAQDEARAPLVEAVALLDSMVRSGERHSAESLDLVRRALSREDRP